jgi:hypothetical protein
LGRAGSLGFAARVAACCVATAAVATVILGWHRPASSAVRGLPPWPALGSAQVPAAVQAAGLPLLPAPGQPGSVVLRPHQEIAVVFRQGAARIPSGYAFPAGT